jgi:hypothetical protein
MILSQLLSKVVIENISGRIANICYVKYPLRVFQCDETDCSSGPTLLRFCNTTLNLLIDECESFFKDLLHFGSILFISLVMIPDNLHHILIEI